MGEQIFEEAVDHMNIGVESDLDKILQYLAGEDACCQRSTSTLTHSDHPAFYTPKIDSFDQSPWLSSPLAKDEPYCFASQILPEDPDVHLANVSSSLLALERELLDPFTPDLATSSITDDIQTATACSDNLKQGMIQLQVPDVSRVISSVSHVYSSGHAYSPPKSSGRFYPFSELLFAGQEVAAIMNTPNSSSSSSSREEAILEENSDVVVTSPDDHRVVFGSKRKVAAITVAADESLTSDRDCTKQKKTSRRGKKRVREARYTIQTRSDKEVLEDGYKWRKYGQKAVKNSPHPRSYYRCTFCKCSVKKTVERSCKDPGLIISTYEGVHAHPSPSAIRSNRSSSFPKSMHEIVTPPLISRNQTSMIHPLQQLSCPAATSTAYNASCTINPRIITFESSTQFRGGAQYRHLPPLDRGLLEDMLPPTIRTSTF